MSRAELVTELADAERLAPEWDALAVAASRPESGPAWMLNWWRHASPPGGQLRIVAVRDGGELVGIAPLWVSGGEPAGVYRLVASDLQLPVSPLALPDRAWETAGAVARALAHAEPRPATVMLAPLRATSPWVAALREQWPGRVRPVTSLLDRQLSALVCLREQSYEAHVASLSQKSRSNVRRYRRRFEREGGSFRLCTQETVAADIATFIRLHAQRWAASSGSYLLALGDRLPVLLTGLANDLGAGERFRIWTAELGGEPIAAHLSIAAGEEVLGINLGWDERYRSLSAPRLALMNNVEDGYRRGVASLELGWGRLDYKAAYTNGWVPVEWSVLHAPSRALPRSVARVLPAVAQRRARATAKRVLSPETVERARALEHRVLGARRRASEAESD